MAQKKKTPKIYYGDQFAITALKGHNYSIRVRLDPDAEFGGPHETWHWSKSKKVAASSIAKAIVEAEQYRDELLEGNHKTDLTVAQYARQWQEERLLQAEATYKSNGVAKPSFRTIDRDEIEIQRIEKLFPKVTIENLKPENIETVITRMRKDGASEQTIYKMFKKLRQILKRPALAGAIKYNPCDLVDIIHEPKINPVTKNYRRITEETAAEFVS